ncbi:DUF6345 domain-containing protein [Deferrisoma camini]|uniref:DUF6345 domain-containing protein n=1 Tax=Deferrisoma camini TaxID=1035120 RepID=UPI0004B62C1F|nr:DUF6345 domain-containing protein [Deferrisoma camini]
MGRWRRGVQAALTAGSMLVLLGGCGGTTDNGLGTATGGGTGGSRIGLKVAVPVPIPTDFCARIRVSGGDFTPITMDKGYPGGTSSVETVVPNIPAGPDRRVELGLFEDGVCGEFGLADWYGTAVGVSIAPGEVTIVELTLQSLKGQPTTGSIVIRGNKALTQRRLHGEVVGRDTLDPIAGAVCKIFSGPNEIGSAVSGSTAANLGVLNTLAEVDLDTDTLTLECTHPLYQAVTETALLIQDPADPLFGTFIATVEMVPGAAKLPVFQVTGNALSEGAAGALVESLGLATEGVPLDEGGALRFVDPKLYQAVPMTALGEVPEDEEGQAIQAEGFDFDQIAKMPVLSQAEALARVKEALAQAGADPGKAGGALEPGVFLNNTLFEAFDTKGEVLARTELETLVSYRFRLHGLPLIGPGADVQFSMNGAGQTTQAVYSLPAVQMGEEMDLLPLNQAAERARRLLQRAAAAQGLPAAVRVLPPRVVYYAPPLSQNVRVIVPHYEFGGTVRVGDEEVFLRNVLLPAVKGGPEISLEVTVNGDDTVVASAVLTGGTEPFTYQWTSSSTALDPKVATAGPNITYVLLPKETIAEETVSLIVTDANGLVGFASQTVEVSVAPPPKPMFQVVPMTAGVVDFGVEYVGTCGGLPGSAANASGFRNALQGKGWTRRFYWPENSAWEQDFKDPSKPGGDDSSWADNADWVFYTGHANGSGFSFCNNTHTDGFLRYTDAKWGDKDVEWITIAACGPLQQTSGGKSWAARWGPAFDGLHMIMAYATTSYDNSNEGRLLAEWATGKSFGFFTFPPLPVRAAWVQTAKQVQPSQVTWAVMGVIGRNGMSNYNDYVHGAGPVGPDIRGADIVGWWRISGSS